MMLFKQQAIVIYSLCIYMLYSAPAFATIEQKDSNYVYSYKDDITARLYLSQKYTSIGVPASSTNKRFRYIPNTSLNTGIGATYKNATLNLGVGLPLLNTYKRDRGRTRYLDLQAHLYPSKFVFDFYGQFYKGYFIAPKNFINNAPEFYYKPDLRVLLLGTSAMYVFNHQKFSHRSAFIQDEWQKKSAGTLLLGADFYYGTLNSDSLILPDEIASNYIQGDVSRMRFINFGPSFGYAYNYIYKQNWFICASATVNTAINFVNEKTEGNKKSSKTSLYPNLFYRMAIGYNSNRWVVSASLLNSVISVNGAKNEGLYLMNTGNYRLTFARRFTPSKKVKSVLEPVEKIIEIPQNIIPKPDQKD